MVVDGTSSMVLDCTSSHIIRYYVRTYVLGLVKCTVPVEFVLGSGHHSFKYVRIL